MLTSLSVPWLANWWMLGRNVTLRTQNVKLFRIPIPILIRTQIRTQNAMMRQVEEGGASMADTHREVRRSQAGRGLVIPRSREERGPTASVQPEKLLLFIPKGHDRIGPDPRGPDPIGQDLNVQQGQKEAGHMSPESHLPPKCQLKSRQRNRVKYLLAGPVETQYRDPETMEIVGGQGMATDPLGETLSECRSKDRVTGLIDSDYYLSYCVCVII